MLGGCRLPFRLEHEYLGLQLLRGVVGAHERADLSAGQTLDDPHRWVLDRGLHGGATLVHGILAAALHQGLLRAGETALEQYDHDVPHDVRARLVGSAPKALLVDGHEGVGQIEQEIARLRRLRAGCSAHVRRVPVGARSSRPDGACAQPGVDDGQPAVVLDQEPARVRVLDLVDSLSGVLVEHRPRLPTSTAAEPISVRRIGSLGTLPLVLVFAVSAAAIWAAGTKLAGATDALDTRLGIGSAFGGLILLAIVTNLPEIAITASAAVQDHLGLAVGNLLGGIAIQTVVLAVLDVFSRRDRPLTFLAASLILVLEAVGVMAIVALAFMGSQLKPSVNLAGVSPV